MRALPHLKSSVYVEDAQGAAIPLFGVGTPLPAVRRHTLPALHSRQTVLTLHILCGSPALDSERQTLGKWLIGGAQSSAGTASRLRIQFTIDAAGSLALLAVQDKEQLDVTPPRDGTPRLPVDATGIEPERVARAWEQLREGEESQVREELAMLLQAEPDSLAGWALLAALVAVPRRKADCYRQVLRLDPGNLAAVAVLRALPTSEPDAAPAGVQPLPIPAVREDGALVCPRCGAVMEVRHDDDRGKHAFCPGCGAATDLPPTLHSAGTRLRASTPTPVVALAGPEEPAGLAPAGESQAEARADIKDEDAVIAELVRRKAAQQRSSTSPARGGMFSRLVRRFGREGAGRESAAGSRQQAVPAEDPLDPQLVLRLAGGPLSEKERIHCPDCHATVSRGQDTCPWCSASLA